MFRSLQRRLIALFVVAVFAIAVVGGAILSPHGAEAHYSSPIACTIALDSYDYAMTQFSSATYNSEAYWYWQSWADYWNTYVGIYC
jgi:hypothetical protein